MSYEHDELAGNMGKELPPIIQLLIDAYIEILQPLRSHFYGVYIYGSIALGAFEEKASDIDIIALIQGEWTSREVKELKALHTRLLKTWPHGKRLEIFYIPITYLGTMHPTRERATYPTVHNGIFSADGHGGLNAVTWWIIKHQGICLLGPECAALPLTVTWEDVLETMRFNLDVYFARRLKQPYLYLVDATVEFAVSNMCRIFTTIEDGKIDSKTAALARGRERLPAPWQPLLVEAARLRHHQELPSHYRHRIRRMSDTLAFIRYGQLRGRQALVAASQLSASSHEGEPRPASDTGSNGIAEK